MSITQYLSSILHLGSQYMLVPAMIMLILLVIVTIFCLGALIVEYFTERRHFKVNHKQVIARMHDADYKDMVEVIQHANLLKSQVTALTGVARNMGLPDDELFAMAQVELEKADTSYKRRVNLTDTISKIGPMCGLMGTLIPLGPGIVAMGQGDVSALSSSLLIAFDTTIAGLIAAVVSLIISRIRRTWYGQYNTMLQAMMSCILEEAACAREEGVKLPYGYDPDAPAAPAGAKTAAKTPTTAGATPASAGAAATAKAASASSGAGAKADAKGVSL